MLLFFSTNNTNLWKSSNNDNIDIKLIFFLESENAEKDIRWAHSLLLMVLGFVEDWWNILVIKKENIVLASQLQVSDLSLSNIKGRCFSWGKATCHHLSIRDDIWFQTSVISVPTPVRTLWETLQIKILAFISFTHQTATLRVKVEKGSEGKWKKKKQKLNY